MFIYFIPFFFCGGEWLVTTFASVGSFNFFHGVDIIFHFHVPASASYLIYDNINKACFLDHYKNDSSQGFM